MTSGQQVASGAQKVASGREPVSLAMRSQQMVPGTRQVPLDRKPAPQHTLRVTGDGVLAKPHAQWAARSGHAAVLAVGLVASHGETAASTQ